MEEIRQRALLGVEYICNSVTPTGRFVYEVDPLNPKQKAQYNMLRHSGAMYCLSQYALKFGVNDLIENALNKTSSYIISSSIAPVPGNNKASAVWFADGLIGNGSNPVAKLGGAGLTLTALCQINQIHPDKFSSDLLKSLAEFILICIKEDGGFYSKMKADGSFDAKFQSLYYPGEAALGLATLYGQDGDPRWMNGACRLIGDIALSRANQEVVEADHWALLATEKMLKVASFTENTTAMLMSHAMQVVNGIIGQYESSYHKTGTSGCFTADGRVCPTATRLEGLIAALKFLPKNSPEINNIRLAVLEGLGFLSYSQIDRGDFKGAFPEAIYPNKNSTHRNMRIDYTQHATSAFTSVL